MPAVVTRAHAAGAGTIRLHQAAADMNSSAVLLGFSFEREHRPNWRRAFGKRPFPCEIETNAHDEGDMVAYDGIAADRSRRPRQAPRAARGSIPCGARNHARIRRRAHKGTPCERIARRNDDFLVSDFRWMSDFPRSLVRCDRTAGGIG